jgi:integrase
VCKHIDIDRVTTKVSRQTYLTLAHLKGIADTMAQAQAGHTHGRTTMTYVKPTIEHRKEHARSMAEVLHGDDEV